MVRVFACLLLALLAAPLAAIQMQEVMAESPVTGQRFPMVFVPVDARGANTLADMGADTDGCRHSSGIGEYEYAVATCPFSYFSALAMEWDEATGRFRDRLPPSLIEWVRKEFNSEQKLDFERLYKNQLRDSQATGRPAEDRKDFVIRQSSIPLERRFRYAYLCYQKRGARPAILAKVSLTAAWALRGNLNLPIANQTIDGGYEEVNALTRREVKDGEAFVLSKWLGVYQRIFEKQRLTREGYLVAGLAYFGLALRDGDLERSRAILAALTKRFQNDDKAQLPRDLVRQRTRLLDEYVRFTELAAANFITAIASEEFPRQELPSMLLAVAECLRRSGREGESMDWYLALGRMSETQPGVRADIRAQGRAPGPEAPFLVQIGWTADELYARLTAKGVVHGGEIGGAHRKLLSAVVLDGLGNPEYVNPEWRPRTDGDARDVELMLQLIGSATLVFASRFDRFPDDLGELWATQQLRDRNRVNRFHCPVTGKPFLYAKPAGGLQSLSLRQVLVAGPAPIETNQGPRYAAYLVGDKVVWSDLPLRPGEVATK